MLKPSYGLDPDMYVKETISKQNDTTNIEIQGQINNSFFFPHRDPFAPSDRFYLRL